MTKLSDAQLVVLSAACQRPNRNLLPLPERMKGGAAQKIVASLIGTASSPTCADRRPAQCLSGIWCSQIR